jgi:outer membrane protein assembly factor BamE (lipoprotein component of BamABCDE complex)
MSAKGVARGIGKTIKWLIIVLVGIVALVIVLAIIGLGKASNDADSQSKKVTAHLSQIKLGMTRTQVKAIVGKPDSTQRMVTSGLVDDTWYYGTLSAKGSYQFVFENGKLTAKNRY